MPKLTNHNFLHDTPDGHHHFFESEIHVSTDGEFSCTVPEYLVEALAAVGRQRSTPGHALYVKKLKVNHRAFGPSKAELLRFVDEAYRQHHRAEVRTELVICYDWYAEVNYWLNPDGTMAANGSMPDAVHRNADGSGGNWAVNHLRNGSMISANETAKHFSVGVYAAIHKRVTYSRASGDTVKWEHVTQFGTQASIGEWGQKLRGLCGISPPKSPDRLRQLPYTEEAARFFYESMMAMCEMGRRFQAFFGDEANVLAAIEGRGPALLKGPSSAALSVAKTE